MKEFEDSLAASDDPMEKLTMKKVIDGLTKDLVKQEAGAKLLKAKFRGLVDAKEEELAREAVAKFKEQQAAEDAAKAQRLADEARAAAEADAARLEAETAAAAEFGKREGSMKEIKEQLAYWEKKLEGTTDDTEIAEIWATLGDLEAELFGYQMEVDEQQAVLDEMAAEKQAKDEANKKQAALDKKKRADVKGARKTRLGELEAIIKDAAKIVDGIVKEEEEFWKELMNPEWNLEKLSQGNKDRHQGIMDRLDAAYADLDAAAMESASIKESQTSEDKDAKARANLEKKAKKDLEGKRQAALEKAARAKKAAAEE